jgi:hypothetical protein
MPFSRWMSTDVSKDMSPTFSRLNNNKPASMLHPGFLLGFLFDFQQATRCYILV